MAILFVGPTSTYPSIAAAMLLAGPGDTIQLESGYSNETATVSHSGMTVTGDASSTGIVLHLAVGVSAFAAGGAAPIEIFDAADANAITGNAGGNLITVTAGIDSVDGGLGIDRLVVDYSLATGAVTGTAAHFTEAGGGARSVTLTVSTIEHFTVLTGGGADTLTVADGDNIISSGLGADTVTAGNGNNNIDVGSGANTVTAGNGANIVIGGDGADTITVLDGGNFIDAGDGVNIITSGAGNDTILSGTGADTIISGGGVDLVTVTGGLDSADLGGGDDRVIVDYSAMLTNVSGGVTGGGLAGGYTGHIADLAGAVLDFAAAENFTITTGSGADAIITGDGVDVLGGGSGDDVLNAGGGDDVLDGGADADTMIGGADNDTYFVDNIGDVTTELAGGGYDQVVASLSWTLGDEIEWLSLAGSANINGTGNALANRLDGNGGDNLLTGGIGNDRLIGGAGADTMIGGADDDTYYIDDIGDVTTELAGGGYDRVVASLSWTLGDEIEWLSLAGTGNINGTGNALANRLDGNGGDNLLTGGIGNDWLNGGAGADTMIGGADDDTYSVDNIGDVTTELAGGGYDRVVASLSWTLGDEIEWLSLAGSGNINGTGNALANRLDGNGGDNLLTGGIGNDWLNGGAGADTMIGGADDDKYSVDNIGDVTTELAGGGYDRVVASLSWTLGDEIEWLSLAGSGNINGTGNALANRIDGNGGDNLLTGGIGNDRLSGGAGADTMIGGAGMDRLNGGAGADVVRFLAANEAGDQVSNYLAADDAIEILAAGFGGGLFAGIDLLATGRYIENLTGAADSPFGIGQFVFETDASGLWWDADGGGGVDQILLATFVGLSTLGAGELVVIA